MGRIIYNKDKSQSAELPDLDVDVIALSMSGGADSALLTYLVAKEIVDTGSETRILPFTRKRPYPADHPRDWNVPRAAGIQAKITELLGKNVFLDHFIEPIDKEQTKEEEAAHVRDLHHRLEEMVAPKSFRFYYGVTSNPSEEEMIKHNFLSKWRCDDRDPDKREKRPSQPLGLVDKRFLADVYESEGVLDEIYPITYSCEGSWAITNGYKDHCGECWWCKERFWAFGRYV